MVILNYIIPKALQTNDFVKSLHAQFTEKGELSIKQTEALEGMLDIRLDFFDWNFEPTEEDKEDWDDMIKKLKRNRFRSSKNYNKCVRALEYIVHGNKNQWLNDEVLGRNYDYYGYRRYR